MGKAKLTSYNVRRLVVQRRRTPSNSYWTPVYVKYRMNRKSYLKLRISISQCIWILIMYYIAELQYSSAKTIIIKRFSASPGFGKRLEEQHRPADIYPISFGFLRRNNDERFYSDNGFGRHEFNGFGKRNREKVFFAGSGFGKLDVNDVVKRKRGDRYFARNGFGNRNEDGVELEDTSNQNEEFEKRLNGAKPSPNDIFVANIGFGKRNSKHENQDHDFEVKTGFSRNADDAIDLIKYYTFGHGSVYSDQYDSDPSGRLEESRPLKIQGKFEQNRSLKKQRSKNWFDMEVFYN